jgi:hypothetical protein
MHLKRTKMKRRRRRRRKRGRRRSLVADTIQMIQLLVRNMSSLN